MLSGIWQSWMTQQHILYTSGFYSNGFLQCSVILWSKQAHIERDEITSANFIRKDAAIFLHIMSVICTLHFVDKTIPVKWLMNVHERVIRVLYYCVSGEQTNKKQVNKIRFHVKSRNMVWRVQCSFSMQLIRINGWINSYALVCASNFKNMIA